MFSQLIRWFNAPFWWAIYIQWCLGDHVVLGIQHRASWAVYFSPFHFSTALFYLLPPSDGKPLDRGHQYPVGVVLRHLLITQAGSKRHGEVLKTILEATRFHLAWNYLTNSHPISGFQEIFKPDPNRHRICTEVEKEHLAGKGMEMVETENPNLEGCLWGGELGKRMWEW